MTGPRIQRPLRSRIRGRLNPSVHYFKRACSTVSIPGNALYTPTAPYGAAWSPLLGNIVALSELTPLFDQYKITNVVLKFHLRMDPGAQAAAQAYVPRLFWYRDYDDAAVPTSLDIFKERGNLKTTYLSSTRPVVIRFKPNTLDQVYRGVTPGYSPSWNKWIDINSSDTAYYGIVWAVNQHTNTSQIIDIEATYTVAFRGVK